MTNVMRVSASISAQVIRTQLRRNHQIDRLGALALLVRFDLEGDALSFGQILQSGPLHRGDVHEHIAAAVIGLDEAIAPFSIEELDRIPSWPSGNSSPALLPPRRAFRVPADRTCAAGEHGHCCGLGARADPSWIVRGLVTPPLPFAEAERKASPCRTEHNIVRGELPTVQIGLSRRPDGLGTSSLNRPAPPWPSGFSSSGRIAFNSPISVHGGLTINRPADTSPPPASCGATLNSSRRHFPGGAEARGCCCDMPGQAVGGAPAFHRIPQQIAAGRPFGEGPGKALGHPLEFVLLFERRIDQNQAAALVRRHEGRQRHPAVEVDHAGLGVAPERLDQALARFRFDLAGGEAILRPQQRAGDQRRAGIG